jgi:hypothetical protein
MRRVNYVVVVLALASLLHAQSSNQSASAPSHISAVQEETISLAKCAQMVLDEASALKIPDTREIRFQGKVSKATDLCRGGEKAIQFRGTPWVDWSNYWGTGDLDSLPKGFISAKLPANRGVVGALVDLELQRIELIKFNLFDNAGTYPEYVQGLEGVGGGAIKVWPEMRLAPTNPFYSNVGGDGPQVCKGDLIRWRTTTGICNDLLNPAMGSSGMLFARNVEFESSFPDLGLDQLTRNRHGGRLSLLEPDPQVISRRLFTRIQNAPERCNQGYGLPNDSKDANCDYQAASFFNVLAAYWIQFMTHDWFSHLEEGHNAPEYMSVGCATKLVDNVEVPLTPDDIERLGCRPADRIDQGFVAQDTPPGTFVANDVSHFARAPKTMRNTNTAWWDASQIYGFDDLSRQRVKRDAADPAKLLLVPVAGQPGPGYLPVFGPNDPINPEWAGQEAAGFPDNWTVGLSFLHNLFAREHNSFVTEFRRISAQTPNADCGLRDPARPKQVIRYRDVTPDELFEVARLVVAAEIAKIHTTEWTPQLLYNEPLYFGMNGNWNGLLGAQGGLLAKALSNVVTQNFGKSEDVAKATQWYSVFASGPGIFGLGSKAHGYNITNPKFTNGGVNHFGSPFNFPEEFVSVYRLHPLVPDLLEYRDLSGDPNKIVKRVPVVETFQGKATAFMQSMGMANWGLTFGRQRLGALTLHNSPLFLQNLKLSRLDSPTQQIDVVALDIIRDREHGVPRFNEFRRQYGLRQLTSFDDFIDPGLDKNSTEYAQQKATIDTLRELYGQHVCDASKVITDAQVNDDGTPINDCLGHENRSIVDNIEDVDTAVGYLAEYRRPHGFAISETQFVVFILNASRRLFSDRFFTSCFRPEFYTTLGIHWVNDNGPGPVRMEKGTPNGHRQPVSPMKRILMRNIPELTAELDQVINAFDPWARDRGTYYSLDWTPRPDAQSDESFPKSNSVSPN